MKDANRKAMFANMGMNKGFKKPTFEATQEIIMRERNAEQFHDVMNKIPFSVQGAELREKRYNENKYYKEQEKIDRLKTLGISSKEESSVKRALNLLRPIKYERDISGKNITSVGFIDPLNTYGKVSYKKYSNFMSNVRGMRSLAGKVEIESITPITEKIYKDITEGIANKGYKRTTNFMGATQTMRNDKIVEKNKSRYDLLKDL